MPIMTIHFMYVTFANVYIQYKQFTELFLYKLTFLSLLSIFILAPSFFPSVFLYHYSFPVVKQLIMRLISKNITTMFNMLRLT